MINIEELTIKQIREVAALVSCGNKSSTVDASIFPYRLGKNYFIRTVTHHHTGQLVAVTEHELVLEKAAWIADDGRFTQALATSTFSEVEMFPAGRQVIVGRGSVVDAVEIDTLPTTQK